MVDDLDLYDLAEALWIELDGKGQPFHYGEVAMNLEYITGVTADEIEARLGQIDEENYARALSRLSADYGK